MTDAVFYEGGGFRVTRTLLKTPRKTYALQRIEYVSLRRGLLALTGLPALGLLGFTLAFWRYLYAGEKAALLAGTLGALALAWQVGTLRVHSLALRDGELAASLASMRRLRAVRDAVEAAMAEQPLEDRR